MTAVAGHSQPRQCPCCYRPGRPFCDDCDPKGSADRLQGLRALLKAHALDAYIVTSEAGHHDTAPHVSFSGRRGMLTPDTDTSHEQSLRPFPPGSRCGPRPQAPQVETTFAVAGGVPLRVGRKILQQAGPLHPLQLGSNTHRHKPHNFCSPLSPFPMHPLCPCPLRGCTWLRVCRICG